MLQDLVWSGIDLELPDAAESEATTNTRIVTGSEKGRSREKYLLAVGLKELILQAWTPLGRKLSRMVCNP